MIGMDATAISAAVPSSSSSSSSEDLLLRALIDRGWHFKDMDRIRGLIKDQLALPNYVCTVDSIESELLNMDLRSIGGKCLPEPSMLRKTSHLQGPMVLQVQLRSKAYICSGILCLNEKVIAILGGVVQSLYEEWKLKRKYLDVSRHTLGLSQENASSCPPPFEKLEIRALVQGTGATKGKYCSSGTTEFSGSASNDITRSLAAKGECSSLSCTSGLQKINASVDSATDDINLLHTVGENKDKPTCSSARSKVIASEPVQNQAAAQKLLQKTSQPNFNDRTSRSQRHRRKDKEEESPSITLDEWERRKTGMNLPTMHEPSNTSQDEDLARQLQNQFDLEDVQAMNSSHVTEAKSITMSMFNFERDDAAASGRTEFRGRGRGRGRGRSRGRGRVRLN
ncbi:uncharacterized protein LOC105166443 isoform X2 [Sesamum indicum]|uniref:Uncharacterized protein LOC105166443 isoform X2 n=1 Tax=Sesamum indicum TaxID=4182 RepID=A0A6I9TIX3_SESIN|nr:uncharacterized protein LOC105166443 isoform X2 [Sesamum indicum]